MKTIFQNEAEIPESLKDKVTKLEDGTWVHEGTGLVDKNKELLESNARLKKVADLLRGADVDKLTPEKIRQALEEQENAAAREQQINERIQAAVQQNSQTKQADIDKANKAVEKMRGSLERYLIDAEVTREIAAAEGDARFILPTIRDRMKVVEKDGEYSVQILGEDKKTPALDGDGNPVSIKGFIGGLKEDKAYATVFKTSVAGGTGTAPQQVGSQQQAQQQRAGGLVVAANGTVTIPRAMAKDNSVYREAVALVKNDASKVFFEPDTTTA